MKTKNKMILITGVILFLVCNMTDTAKSETVVQFTDSEPVLTTTIFDLQDSNIESKSYGNAIYKPSIPYDNISELEFAREDSEYQKTINQLMIDTEQIPNASLHTDYKVNEGILGKNWIPYSDITEYSDWSLESGSESPIINNMVDTHSNVIEFVEESEIRYSFSSKYQDSIEIWVKTDNILANFPKISLKLSNTDLLIAFSQESGKFGYYNQFVFTELSDSDTNWHNIRFEFNCYDNIFDLYFDTALIIEGADYYTSVFGGYINSLSIEGDSSTYIDGVGIGWDDYEAFTNYPNSLIPFYDYKTDNNIRDWPESGDIDDWVGWWGTLSSESSIPYEGHDTPNKLSTDGITNMFAYDFSSVNEFYLEYWICPTVLDGNLWSLRGGFTNIATINFDSGGYIDLGINTVYLSNVLTYNINEWVHIAISHKRNDVSTISINGINMITTTGYDLDCTGVLFYVYNNGTTYLDSFGIGSDGYIPFSNLNPTERDFNIYDSQEIRINFGYWGTTNNPFFPKWDYISFANNSYTLAMSNEVNIPSTDWEYKYFSNVSKRYLSIQTETMIKIDGTLQSHQYLSKRIIIYQSDTILNENPELVIEFQKFPNWIVGEFFTNSAFNITWSNSINTKEFVVRYRLLHSLNYALGFSELDNIFNTDIVFINDPFVAPDEPDLPDFPSDSDPDLPYWEYRSYRLVSESSRIIEFEKTYETVNHSDDTMITNDFEYEYEFEDLSVEAVSNKYFYNPNTISVNDWGDWGINNWMRNLLITFLNALIFLMQAILFLVVIAFQFLLMQPILWIITLVWNYPIYWIMFGAIGMLFYLIYGFVWLWEMINQIAVYLWELTIIFFTYLWEEIILPIWNWLMENVFEPIWEWIVEQSTIVWNWFKDEGLIWLFEAIILAISFILAICVMVITFGTADWDTTMGLIYELVLNLNMVFIDFIFIFINDGITLFQYMVIYVVLVGFLFIKMIYAKSRGFVSRAERLQTSINVFKIPIVLTIAIFQTLVGFFLAKSQSSSREE